MATWGDLTDRLRVLLNDPESVFWADAELQAMLSEGQDVLAEHVLALKRTVTLVRRPGTWLYQLESIERHLMAPHRVWLPDLHRRLQAISLQTLDQDHRRWLEVTGDPWVWVPIDWRQFLLWPIPAEGQGVIEIDYYAWPLPMIDEGETPEWHPSSDEVLLLYAEGLGYLKQWTPGMATQRFQAFAVQAQRLRSQAAGRQTQNAGFVRSRR